MDDEALVLGTKDVFVPDIFAPVTSAAIARVLDMDEFAKRVAHMCAGIMSDRIFSGTKPDGSGPMPIGRTTFRPRGLGRGVTRTIHAERSNRGYGTRTTDVMGNNVNARGEWIVKNVDIAPNQMKRVLRGVPFKISLRDLEEFSAKIVRQLVNGEPMVVDSKYELGYMRQWDKAFKKKGYTPPVPWYLKRAQSRFRSRQMAKTSREIREVKRLERDLRSGKFRPKRLK